MFPNGEQCGRQMTSEWVVVKGEVQEGEEEKEEEEVEKENVVVVEEEEEEEDGEEEGQKGRMKQKRWCRLKMTYTFYVSPIWVFHQKE